MQEAGVQVTVKHFVGNEQEYLRIVSQPSWRRTRRLISKCTQGNPGGGYIGANLTQTLSDTISDAAMHETYMLPFAEAVREGSAAIMCSYNKINGTAACESPSTVNLIKKVGPSPLKQMIFPDWGFVVQELNFPGFFISDWGKHA